jgi:hypothetical protein
MELANGGNLEEYLVLDQENTVLERKRSRSLAAHLASLRTDRIDAFDYGGISLGMDGKKIR